MPSGDPHGAFDDVIEDPTLFAVASLVLLADASVISRGARQCGQLPGHADTLCRQAKLIAVEVEHGSELLGQRRHRGVWLPGPAIGRDEQGAVVLVAEHSTAAD